MTPLETIHRAGRDLRELGHTRLPVAIETAATALSEELRVVRKERDEAIAALRVYADKVNWDAGETRWRSTDVDSWHGPTAARAVLAKAGVKP